METFSHLWQYLAELFLEWETFQTRVVDKIQVSLKSDKNNAYFTWRRFDSLTISLKILFRMRNVLDKRRRENQNTCFMFNSFFLKMEPFVR
jgi:hypothetical protein